ncbi:MAG: ATP-binding protein [Desulfosarcinaceae bacterium]
MILSISPEALLESLVNPRPVYTENIVPGRMPHSSHNPYRPGYEWLFVYERQLAKILRPWMTAFRHPVIGDGGLIGEGGLLCEALSNAFYYGHGKDPQIALGVRVWVGEAGLVVGIQDQGPGFDVAEVMHQFQKGEAYFHTAGNGLRAMATSRRFAVAYNAKGTCWYLLYRYDEDYAALTTTANPLQLTKIPIHQVPPPEIPVHLRAALLFNRSKGEGLSFGLTTATARQLVAWLNTLLPDLDRLAGRFGFRKTITLSIEADDGCWLVDCFDHRDRALICLPEPQIPVAVARACLSRLHRFFNSRNAKSDAPG